MSYFPGMQKGNLDSDVRGLEPARQIRDRLHVERPVFVIDRAVIEARLLDNPGNAA